KAPDEIAVVGVDNDEMISALTLPSLSSVTLDCERGGYAAAELLDGMMRGEIDKPQTILVRALRVVPRSSTDMIAIDDPHVSAALQFIRDHARRQIGVDDVASMAKLSRRALEIRFRQFLGRSVREEIQRVRIMRVQQFLIDTNLPAWRIAEETGFNSLEYLSRVFRKSQGVSLTEYRATHRPA
ncbi:MAG: substrate-binding domain-containing protein, partial [Blastopirellula sp. JB062]